MDDPFLSFVKSFAALTHTTLSADGCAPALESLQAEAPVALVFSPHPDDECLSGGIALRLRHEGWRVVILPVTFGSDETRRVARRAELAQACAVLGFDCLSDEAGDFGSVRAEDRENDPVAWREKVERAVRIAQKIKPAAVLFPHREDAHVTHIGAHWLAMDTLALMPLTFSCALVQTEYWQPTKNPTLMIELSADHVSILLRALVCHAGEIARNPYHLRFPAYLIDNVRRGGELVGGVGAAGMPFDFAMLYRLDRWENGGIKELTTNYIVKVKNSISSVLAG